MAFHRPKQMDRKVCFCVCVCMSESEEENEDSQKKYHCANTLLFVYIHFIYIVLLWWSVAWACVHIRILTLRKHALGTALQTRVKERVAKQNETKKQKS